ncbi:hypothetical protein ASE37_17635 [Rhizobium sp. Root268]|nr:hypothetical protein ASC86_17720 [Rhizobium sp. Root1212]KRD22533.1 hypothetical protein ASE37_17635 [Rhizobium sp. Root268]
MERGRFALSEARQRRDQQLLLTKRAPITLGIFDQGLGFRDSDVLPAALQLIVENDARGLPILPGSCAIAEKPSTTVSHRAFGFRGEGREIVEGASTFQ